MYCQQDDGTEGEAKNKDAGRSCAHSLDFPGLLSKFNLTDLTIYCRKGLQLFLIFLLSRDQLAEETQKLCLP